MIIISGAVLRRHTLLVWLFRNYSIPS